MPLPFPGGIALISKIRSRRALLTAFLALALPLTLAACGEDSGDGTDAAQEEPADEESTPAEEPTEEPSEEAPEEGALVHVVATEYKFEGIDPTLPAGPTTFHLMNEGKEQHEFVLALKKTDTPTQKLLKLPQKQAEKELQFFGGTFAKPGGSSEQPLEAELVPGNYVAVCFVASKGGPPHAFQGMVHEFTVE